MAKSKCFWQNRIHLTFHRILQSNPEKGGGLRISLDQKNNTTLTLKTFQDHQLCFCVKKKSQSHCTKNRKTNLETTKKVFFFSALKKTFLFFFYEQRATKWQKNKASFKVSTVFLVTKHTRSKSNNVFGVSINKVSSINPNLLKILKRYNLNFLKIKEQRFSL